MRDLARLNAMPFARFIGFTFEDAPEGTSIVLLEVQPHHQNIQGAAHGGLLPIIIDAAGATAVSSKAPDAFVVTADLRTNFIAAVAVGDRLTAVGNVVHLGGSTGYAQVVVTDANGRTLALGQVTCVVKARRSEKDT